MGEEGGGERGFCSDPTLELDPSAFGFLKRLRRESFECNLREGTASAPMPADRGRRERDVNGGSETGSPSTLGSDG